MKKANKTKLYLGMETIKRMSMSSVRGGQSVASVGETVSDLPYDCPTINGGCTIPQTGARCTASGSATVFCTLP